MTLSSTMPSSLRELPAENLRVEARRILGTVGWDFEVTDFAVGHRRILGSSMVA